MSKYDYVKNLKDEEFRRLTGVKKDTFELMLKYLYKDLEKKKKSGKPMTICVEDKLLLALEYLRENRTFFHIATSYGIAKSTAVKISHWVENVLSKCDEFKLPSKRKILESDMQFEVFIVDATETPIERPTTKSKSKKNLKKEKIETINKNNTIQERKRNTQ